MKNLKYSIGLFALATSIALSGCGFKKFEVKELDYEIINENNDSNIGKSLDDGYFARTVYVISFLNPNTLKTNYYFMRCTYEDAGDICTEQDKKEQVMQLMNNNRLSNVDNFTVISSLITYNTIFDDGNYYIERVKENYYKDEKYEYSYRIYEQDLETRDYYSYITLSEKIKDSENNNSNFTATYCRYNNEYLYQVTDDKYEIKITSLDKFYNCNGYKIFTNKELKEMYTELNDNKTFSKK